MLLEVNPCMWDSRTPCQSQIQAGREGLIYTAISHLDLWAAERALIAQWWSREAKKAPSCCDREGRIWKSQKCFPHTLMQDFVLIKSGFAGSFQEQGVTWGTAGRDGITLGHLCAHEAEGFTRLWELCWGTSGHSQNLHSNKSDLANVMLLIALTQPCTGWLSAVNCWPHLPALSIYENYSQESLLQFTDLHKTFGKVCCINHLTAPHPPYNTKGLEQCCPDSSPTNTCTFTESQNHLGRDLRAHLTQPCKADTISDPLLRVQQSRPSSREQLADCSVCYFYLPSNKRDLHPSKEYPFLHTFIPNPLPGLQKALLWRLESGHSTKPGWAWAGVKLCLWGGFGLSARIWGHTRCSQSGIKPAQPWICAKPPCQDDFWGPLQAKPFHDPDFSVPGLTLCFEWQQKPSLLLHSSAWNYQNFPQGKKKP